jgi:hypothetical protein
MASRDSPFSGRAELTGALGAYQRRKWADAATVQDAVPQMPYFPHHCAPSLFSLFFSPSLLLYSECLPLAATRLSSHSNCHHVAHATIAAAPSEHAAKHATSPSLPRNAN